MTALLTEAQPTPSSALGRISADDAERIAHAISESLSKNTRAAYTQAMKNYRAWLANRGTASDIWDPLVIAAYLTSMSEQHRAPSSIDQARAAILRAAQEAGRGDAIRHDAGLRVVMAGIRRERSRAHTRSQARALSAHEIRALISALPETHQGVRDRALVLTMLALGLRASDAATLNLGDIRFIPQGCEVTVRYSKTSSTPVVLALPYASGDVCAVTALRAWISVLDQQTSSSNSDESRSPADNGLFRQIRRGGWPVQHGRMSTDAIGDAITRAAERAGIDTAGLSSHSMRATFATRALESGIPEGEVQRTGRWASADMVRHYDRSSAWARPAASWLSTL